MPSTLKINISHRVGVVWMTRAEVRNAFNETTIAELTDALLGILYFKLRETLHGH